MKKMRKILLSIILVLGMIISPLEGSGSISAEAATDNPMRALWLRPKETSKAQVEAAVKKIADAGINTIFLETVFNGFTIFPVEYDATYQNPMYGGFDVLQAYIDACHARGMQLHAWVESFFIGMAWESSGGPVYKAHKDWLLADKQGNKYEDTMYGPMYFLNPARPECRDWIVNLYAIFVEKYDVDGIQLDYVRYPEKTSTKDYGFDDYTINAFIQQGGSDPTNAKEGSAVAEAFVKFKQEQVTKYVKQCSDTLRAIKPELIISLSVYPFYSQGKSDFMQSAGLWMEKGYGDLIVPMAYYEYQVDQITQSTIALTGGSVQNTVIGLLTQTNNPPTTASSMKDQTNKVLDKGAGVAYFEYESFFGQYNGINYSATLKQGPLKNTQFNVDPSVYASYVGQGAVATPKGCLTRTNSYDSDNSPTNDILVFASDNASDTVLTLLEAEKNTYEWWYSFVLEYNSTKGKWVVTKADMVASDKNNPYETEPLGKNKMVVMFHDWMVENQGDSFSFFLNSVAVGQEYWLVGDYDAIVSGSDKLSGVYLTTEKPGSSSTPGTGTTPGSGTTQGSGTKPGTGTTPGTTPDSKPDTDSDGTVDSKPGEDVTEDTTEDTTEGVTEESTEGTTEESTEGAIEDTTEVSTEDTSNDTTEDITEGDSTTNKRPIKWGYITIGVVAAVILIGVLFLTFVLRQKKQAE